MSIKIIKTINFPYMSADELPICFPASKIISVVEKFIKNIPNPKESPLINCVSLDVFLLSPRKFFVVGFWALKIPLNPSISKKIPNITSINAKIGSGLWDADVTPTPRIIPNTATIEIRIIAPI